ncbi:ABC transporter permease [Chloroflexota bacterium]
MKSLKVAAFMAVKSIARGNRWVFVLIIVMLALVYLNLVFTPAMLAGVVDTINDKIVNTMSGHIMIESKTEEKEIAGIADLMAEIEAVDGVAAVCARSDLPADISYNGERFLTSIYSVEPDKDKRVFNISENLIEGSYLAPGDTNQILLGVQLAGSDMENLELYSASLKSIHAGNVVTVDYPAGLEKQYTVKGIFYVELIQTDLSAFITETEYETLNPLADNTATSLHIRADDGDNLEPILEQIDTLRDGIRYRTWDEVAGILKSMTRTFDDVIRILQVVALIVAAITIFIITYIDLVSKRKQIGIQRAIGITPSSIVLSYVLRAIIYAVVGTLVAVIIFAFIIRPIEARYPFHFPFGDILLPLDIAYLVRSMFILLGVSVVAAFLPAWRTIKIKIIDAIWS